MFKMCLIDAGQIERESPKVFERDAWVLRGSELSLSCMTRLEPERTAVAGYECIGRPCHTFHV